MPKVALLLLATGKPYWKYIDPMLRSAYQNFIPHDVFLWTDCTEPVAVCGGSRIIPLEPQGFPGTTLLRYHTFRTEAKALAQYDYLFYVDIDAFFENKIEPDEILANGITATLHPGYLGTCGTPERRKESTAFIPCPFPKQYFAGGFVGGAAPAFLKMAATIAAHIDQDSRRRITAVWHDESHLNRFLYDNPAAKVLGAEFCYPAVGQEAFFNVGWQRKGNKLGPPKIRLIQKDFCRTCGEKARTNDNFCEEHKDNR